MRVETKKEITAGFCCLDKKEFRRKKLCERFSHNHWLQFIYFYLFIPRQGFVADSFFIYNFMPLNHLVDRRSVDGALSVRGTLSGMTDDADRCNETLCYLDSLVQSVIEVPASFYYLSLQVKLVSLLGKMSLNIYKKKRKKYHRIKTRVWCTALCALAAPRLTKHS